MKRLLPVLALLCCAGLSPAQAAVSGMQELGDAALSDVNGQQGIAMNMEFRINAQADGSAVPASECPDVAALTGGSSCRLAMSFADRTGMWVVMKNYRGTLTLTNIRIDAATLPAAYTAQTNSGASLNPYLCSVWSGSSCTTAFNPNGKPAIQLTTGGWSTAWAAGSTTATFYSFMNNEQYSDLKTLLSIDKLSAEFDCGVTASAASGIYVTGCSSATAGWDGVDRVPGYLRNGISGAALSLRMADGISTSNYLPNAPMQIRLDGRLQIFGY